VKFVLIRGPFAKELQQQFMGNGTQIVMDDLDALMQILPPELQASLAQLGRRDDLLEVILDLGRVPTARYTDVEVVLRETEVTQAELAAVVEWLGDFDADNRAGIARTLHRIAAIRNRRGDIVGLTCRVGRAVYGTIDIIKDLIASGKSILLLGRPGVGKTTMLREAARVLAENKRVVIVDTSNEIGGDGDIPHPAIGRARRMQVALPTLQHEVMIEAVENHNPEVIVIDEIGRELEAMAARTIAERGVQLIATAHGNTLDNLLLNPTLSDLVGGIESVTLSDEEARRRGTQKTVLERRAPPTFDILVEIQARQQVLVHEDVAESVDSLLRGRPPRAQLRSRGENGNIHKDAVTAHLTEAAVEPVVSRALPVSRSAEARLKTLHIFPYGIARNRLERAAQMLQVPVEIVEDLGSAEVLVTTKQHYRQRPKIVADAERRGAPVYVLRANTAAQMESFLAELFHISLEGDEAFERAMRETEEAIRRIGMGATMIDLAPQNAYIRRYQHEMAREAHLSSESFGKDPYRHVRLLQEES